MIEAGRVWGESDAGTGSTAAQRDRPPPRLDNTESFVIIPAEYNVKQLHKIGIRVNTCQTASLWNVRYVAVGVAVAAVGLHVGVSGSLR